MNILIVSYIYPNKSDLRLGLFVHEQAKELVRQGHKVFVLTASPDSDEKEVFENVVVYRIKAPNLLSGALFNFKAFSRIIKLTGKIDIIHLHFVGLNSVMGWITSKIIKVPLVATVHGIDICPKNPLHSILIRFYLSFPKRIMAVSRFIYELAALNADKGKLRIVNNGVDLSKLKTTKKKEILKKELGLENKKILLSVGCLVNRKGMDIIINALPDVIKSVPNLAYLIIGKGDEEANLKNLVKSLNLQGNVRFIGYVSNKEIGNYFNLCDIFVLMSNTIKEKGGIEGFGIVYIEASAMGKPVIGGKSGGTGDSIVDNVTGFRIMPDNHQELSRKLALLLKNKRLRDRMGREGRKRALKNFLWKHNVEKTLKVYNEAIFINHQ
ncbi:glycosyltransferase family 4 protein [Candidatus Woesearchaeota archaeon]|nr:glycosyltransferase family 4 protein [Candidatus Woesearchaeota archaeon]